MNNSNSFAKTFKSLKALTVASIKMYFRNRGAVVFTLLLPLVLLGVFGFLSRGSDTKIKIAVTNHASTDLSKNFMDAVKSVSSFKVSEMPESEAASELNKGDADLQLIIPEQFGALNSQTDSIAPSTVETHYNSAKPQIGQTAVLIVQNIATGFNTRLTKSPEIISITASGVQTNNLGYFDFILPGILSMTIMQLGIFGVSFTFVSLKASGALRRIQATPVHPRNFIFAQAITRLIITLLTISILLGLGIYFFNFHMIGSYAEFALMATLGIVVFLGFGFGIAGWAKDENQVAPIANVIQLPMLMLSGIFFSRDAFPGWLKWITNYFPLTYLSDALRHIANDGQSLAQLSGDLLGLSLWGAIIFVLAVYLFRWE